MVGRGGLLATIVVFAALSGCPSHPAGTTPDPHAPYVESETVVPGVDCTYRTWAGPQGCVVHQEERRMPVKDPNAKMELVKRDVKVACGKTAHWCHLAFYCRCP